MTVQQDKAPICGLKKQTQCWRFLLIGVVFVFITACSSSSGPEEESDSDFFSDIADFFDEEVGSLFSDDEDSEQGEDVTIVSDDGDEFPDLASVPDVDMLSIEERREALKEGLIPDTGALYSGDTLQADSGPILESASNQPMLYPELNPVPSAEMQSLTVPAPAPILREGQVTSPSPLPESIPLTPAMAGDNRMAITPSIPNASSPTVLPPGTSEDPYRSYYGESAGQDQPSPAFASPYVNQPPRQPHFSHRSAMGPSVSQPAISTPRMMRPPVSQPSSPRLNTPPVAVLNNQLNPGIGYYHGRSVRLGTIYFAHGSAKLKTKDQRILKQIATIYQRHGGGIHIVGHASHSTKYRQGGAQHQLVNYRISTQRADQVASALQRMGVPREALSIAAYSDNEPEYAETAPTGEAGNRRVVLYLTRG